MDFTQYRRAGRSNAELPISGTMCRILGWGKFKIQFLLPFLLISYSNSITQAPFAGGSGEEGNPYKVETLEQLQKIGSHTDKHFIQINDIDADDTKSWNDGKGFKPIGDGDVPFSGTYNGAGFKISGLTIQRENDIGMFGIVGNGRIKNTELFIASISGSNRVGGLVGSNLGGQISGSLVTGDVSGSNWIGGLVGVNSREGQISDCHTMGNVSGIHYVGGLVGENLGGRISNSHTTGNVSGNEMIGGLTGLNLNGEISSSHATGDISGIHYVGGLVGENEQGQIISSHATGDISGSGNAIGGLTGRNSGQISDSHAFSMARGGNAVGGLVGRNLGSISSSYAIGNISGSGSAVGGLVGNNWVGQIHDSHAVGDVSGNEDVGGLAGSNNDEITNSYALGIVIGENTVGGLVGVNRENGVIAAAYASGKVAGNEDVGGLVGLNKATIESSYWDIETSEQEQGIGQGPSGGVTGLYTDQMTGVSAFENMSAFDFKETWLLTENYPALYWEDVEALDLPTSAEKNELPVLLKLHQNYPNPFNPTTRIRFFVPEQTHVKLVVYNAIGQQLATLVNEEKSVGKYEITFNAADLSSGVYLYRIQSESHTESRQMLLVK